MSQIVRALVADDDPDLLEMVSNAVARLGIEVVSARSGGELLDKLAHRGPFDVVVTDVAMPWMSGLHVMHSARAAGSSCPVVVMTGHRDAKTTAQVTSLGDHVVLIHKPFSSLELDAALRECLGTALV
jgi:CheY-like chemotaxis protein